MVSRCVKVWRAEKGGGGLGDQESPLPGHDVRLIPFSNQSGS